ncbi:MAG: hypothetical protein AAFY15_11710, partial [Cyanobacteria bacterium J06648_11]
RKLELVDSLRDMKAIFPRIRHILERLPKWMLPIGWDWDAHSNYARLYNPEIGSTLAGEGGDQIGRGDRVTCADIDEAAFLQHPSLVEAALSATADVAFWTSTPNGLGHFFKKRSHLPSHQVFQFHWKDDLRKNDWELWDADTLIERGKGRNAPKGAIYPWYEEQKVNIPDPVTIAQEIDIDYSASVEGIFIPAAYVRAAVDIELPPSGAPIAGMDVASSGPNETVLIPRRGPKVYEAIAWKGSDVVQSAHQVIDRAQALRIRTVQIDADGVGADVCAVWSNSDRDLGFTFVPLKGGASPSETQWESEGRTSKEKFRNARAEWWGLLYERFRKTHNHLNGLEVHPEDELISIPNDPTLIQQLSQPKRIYTETGKIRVESKQQMRDRGLSSPDRADALAYAFAPNPGDKGNAFNWYRNL